MFKLKDTFFISRCRLHENKWESWIGTFQIDSHSLPLNGIWTAQICRSHEALHPSVTSRGSIVCITARRRHLLLGPAVDRAKRKSDSHCTYDWGGCRRWFSEYSSQPLLIECSWVTATQGCTDECGNKEERFGDRLWCRERSYLPTSSEQMLKLS